VLPLSILSRLMRRVSLLLALSAVSAVVLLTASPPPDEPLSDSVGVIEGDAIRVTGPMSVEVVHGQVRTVLRSGGDVRVKSGTARIDLIEGGQINICGPAHLSVLKSGPSLTVALDTGTIHVHIEGAPSLTIYTPQIQAQTVTIGDGPQDVVAGFDAQGAMCLRANRGAIRAEHQLTGQSVLIPQAGDVLFANGQFDGLRTSPGHCACELQAANAAPPPQPELSQLATAGESRKNNIDAGPDAASAPLNPSSAKEEPIYQVFMAPLVYDAKAKTQPEVDPQLIVLVRRVRVRPTLIFQGRVEGETVAAVTPAPAPPANVLKPAPTASNSFVDRVRTFVHKLWSRGS
jgi:hypothetical protein